MTHEELRAKLAELDYVVLTAEAEIEKLWQREERIQALEMNGEELLESYAELVPGELQQVSPEEKRLLYQLLRIEVSIPREGEIKIRLPFMPDEEEFCRQKTAI